MWDQSIGQQVAWSVVRTILLWSLLIGFIIWQGANIRDAIREHLEASYRGERNLANIVFVLMLVAWMVYTIYTQNAAPPAAW